MTKRLAKKQAATMVIQVLSIPLALQHAPPSYWKLSARAQRHALCHVLARQLDIPMSQARRATALPIMVRVVVDRSRSTPDGSLNA